MKKPAAREPSDVLAQGISDTKVKQNATDHAISRACSHVSAQKRGLPGHMAPDIQAMTPYRYDQSVKEWLPCEPEAIEVSSLKIAQLRSYSEAMSYVNPCKRHQKAVNPFKRLT